VKSSGLPSHVQKRSNNIEIKLSGDQHVFEENQALRENGYSTAGYFYLKQNSWTDNYYKLLKAEIGLFLYRHPDSELAKQVADETIADFDLNKKYRDYYSYGFYVAKKN